MTAKTLSGIVIGFMTVASAGLCTFAYDALDKRADRAEQRLDFNDGLHRTMSERMGATENALSNRLTRIETKLESIDQSLSRLANEAATRARLDARDYPALTKGQTNE